MFSSEASADRKLMFMDHCRDLAEGNLVVKVTRTWDPTPVRNGVATTHSVTGDLSLYRLSTPNNIDTLVDSHAGVCYIIHKDHHSGIRAAVIRSVSANPEGHAYGRLMMCIALQNMHRVHGVRIVCLWTVTDDDMRAFNFYKSLGFKVVAGLKKYWDPKFLQVGATNDAHMAAKALADDMDYYGKGPRALMLVMPESYEELLTKIYPKGVLADECRGLPRFYPGYEYGYFIASPDGAYDIFARRHKEVAKKK